MLIDEISTVGIVIFITGIIASLALLISKISNFLPKKENHNSIYESGFKNKEINFSYVLELSPLISFFLIIESQIAWFLVFCIFRGSNRIFGNIFFIKMLAIIIMLSLIVAYKSIYNKKEN